MSNKEWGKYAQEREELGDFFQKAASTGRPIIISYDGYRNRLSGVTSCPCCGASDPAGCIDDAPSPTPEITD